MGTIRKTQKGSASYFGFRPRDDQSASLGYETRTLFEILHAVGAYPSSGKFGGVNDNPSVVSRTSDYFVTAFPNTTTVIVKHYRTHRESWPADSRATSRRMPKRWPRIRCRPTGSN